MKKSILGILKGTFLVSGDAPKNWRFIIYASFLAAVMISSSHSADSKVYQIASLTEQVRELRNEFLDVRSDVQQLKLESTILNTVEAAGLYQPVTPPHKIIIHSKD